MARGSSRTSRRGATIDRHFQAIDLQITERERAAARINAMGWASPRGERRRTGRVMLAAAITALARRCDPTVARPTLARAS